MESHVSYLIKLNQLINELYQFSYTDHSIEVEGKELDGGYNATIYSVAEWLRKKYQENENEISPIISAMALEYYNQFALEKGPFEIIEYMKSCIDKQEFIYHAIETPFLLEELIDCEISEVGDEYNYEWVDVILNTEEGKKIYQKFHPQYEEEKRFDQWWRQVDFYQTKYLSYPIEHFLDFYILTIHAQEQFKNKEDCFHLIDNIMNNLDRRDNLLAQRIWFEMLCFYYNDIQREKESKKEELDLLDMLDKHELLDMVREEEPIRTAIISRFLNNYKIGLFDRTPKNKKAKTFYKKLEVK